MPDLAELIGGPTTQLALRQATVTEAPGVGGTATIAFGRTGAGGAAYPAATISGVRALASASFSNGDVVLVLQNGYDLLILGRAGTTAQTVLPAGAETPWLEVRNTAGDAYVDFTRTPGSGDFSARLINNAAGVLTFNGGRFVIDTGTVDNLHITGAGATIRLDSRDGTGFWVNYVTGGLFRFWNQGDRAVMGTDYFYVSNARIGYAGFYGDFACFAHTNRWSAGNYALLQGPGGDTYLNASSGAAIYIRNANNNKLVIGNDSVEPKAPLALYDNYIRSRSWNDDWHVWHWWSGNDGMRITEYGGLYFRVRDFDPAMELFAYASTRFSRNDQLGGWDTSVLQVRSAGGGSPAMIGWWESGRGAAHIIKSWFSALECRNWDNGGWGIFRGELEDYSSAQAKRNVRSATERLPKAERKAKVKRLRTAHFNRPRGGCANCLGTGLKRENRRLNPGMSDHEKREALPAVVGLFGGALDESPCPDCEGQGKDFKRPHEVKTEEAGWFGFIAEEVEKEFPEAVYYRPSEADQNVVEVSGLSIQALVAILWEEVKDLEERLALAEGKIK